ncbi:MAG: MarR family transcriptional regulator, partial [Nonlabens ulvanivorans]|uniref:MarR family winged helix-turn-helix transcriptional regulator n=1 Tax=Nonlabens ulvanivorans TaxID=906888 RepID=UPI003263C9E6
NLSQLRFLILMAIDRETDRAWLYASELASRLDVSKPVLSRAIKKLTEDTLLCATKDKEDGRAVTLALTEKSEALLKSILPGYFDILVPVHSEASNC